MFGGDMRGLGAKSSFKIELDEIPLMSAFLSAFMERHGFDKEKINKANLALEEIFVNTFMHGYKSSLSLPKDVVQVDLKIDKDSKLVITYRDNASFFDPTITQKIREPLEIGGCGLILVKSIMDLEYRRENNKNIIIMTLK